MKITVLELSEKKRWSEYLSQLPYDRQDIYFTPEFYKLAEMNNEGSAHCFVAEDGDRLALYPFAHDSINKLGFLKKNNKVFYDIQGAYGYNGVATNSYDRLFIKQFYKQLSSYCIDNNIIADFTRFHPLLDNEKFSHGYMKISANRKVVFLDLRPGYDKIWTESYASRNRNMLRKARLNGLQLRFIDNGDACLRFYNSYTKTMKRLRAYHFYYFNEQYFKNLSELLKQNHCYIEVLHEGEVISSLILLIYGKYAHYHLASRKENQLNIGAGNLALDEAIKFAINKGCQTFFLGGGVTKESNNTLLRFKTCFSREIKNFFVGTRIYNEKIYREVCNNWGEKHPEKKEKYSNILLKYRI